MRRCSIPLDNIQLIFFLLQWSNKFKKSRKRLKRNERVQTVMKSVEKNNTLEDFSFLLANNLCYGET